MPVFNVTVTQVFRVTRQITIPVEALSMDDAVEFQSEEDAPSYDDPRWKEERDLQNEEANPA